MNIFLSLVMMAVIFWCMYCGFVDFIKKLVDIFRKIGGMKNDARHSVSDSGDVGKTGEDNT